MATDEALALALHVELNTSRPTADRGGAKKNRVLTTQLLDSAAAVVAEEPTARPRKRMKRAATVRYLPRLSVL